MNSISDENQLDALFARIDLAPSERFHRRMSRAAWTPAGIARRRAWTFTGVTLLLAVAFLVFTPTGRAWAQAALHFFTRTTSDTLPAPTTAPLTWVDVTPGAPAPTPTPLARFSQCGDYDQPKCSVEQVRALVHFPVRELATIPAGMHFTGATGSPDRIGLFYDNGKLTFGLTLVEEPLTASSDLMQWPVGASAAVETVQVGDVTGEFVKGGFKTQLLDNPTFNEAHFNQVWDEKVGVETLHWISNGVFNSMSAYDDDPDQTLPDKAAFVALAAGLTTEPIPARPTYVPPTPTPTSPITFEGVIYDLDVAQVESQAGFKVMQPARLPNIFSLVGAAYDPDQKIVRVFYLEPPLFPEHPFGLRLSEMAVQDPAHCSLCGVSRGDYGDFLTQKDRLVVSTTAKVDEVQINGAAGHYFEGQWNGPTWVPYSSIQTLRWQDRGIAFELYYFGFLDTSGTTLISKADLIAIAESVK